MIENKHLDNVFDLSVEEENYRKIDDKAYAEFKERLKSEPRFYVRMKYSNDDIKTLYNSVKNELMSYVDRYDTENRVKSKLTERGEKFYIGNVIAQLRLIGGTLALYLALDPSQYSTADAIHQDVGVSSEFAETPFLLKLTKTSRVTKAVMVIRDAMTAAGCVKDESYPWLDYASYYSRQELIPRRLVPNTEEKIVSDENDTLIPGVQNIDIPQIEGGEDESLILDSTHNEEFEENGAEGADLKDEISDQDADASEVATDADTTQDSEWLDEESGAEEEKPIYVYENISAPTGRPVFRDVKNIETPMPEDARAPLRKTIFDAPEEETEESVKPKQTKNPLAKQVEVWNELDDYGYHFVPLKQLGFYAIAIALAVVMGIIYKLTPFFTIILIVASVLLMPGVISSYYRQKYEEKRFRDSEAYIEQMLYSFRRNSKIVASLNDALVVFPSGYMHDKIVEAMDYMRNSGDDPDIYANALAIIEDAYPCRRIKSLHRYMIKVEDVGGEHEAGIQTLLKDRRLWIDRMDHFRKECSEIVKEIFISGLFSLGMACLILYMMPSDLYDLSTNVLYQIVTTIFAIVNLAIIQITYRTTVIKLDDDEDVEHSKQIAKKLEWYRNYDRKTEQKNAIKPAIIIGSVGVLGWFFGQPLIMILSLAVVAYLLLLKGPMDHNAAKKAICREVEKSYPDWLLELALLLQTDNMHVAIEKTLPTAPIILKKDLEELSDDIMSHPNDLTPYASFFSFLPLPNIHSSMKLLYSIAEFGTTDESVQISELVERNNMLMDKAERYKNDDKLALVFSIKFIPTLASSLKMMLDLVLFLFAYMSLMGL